MSTKYIHFTPEQKDQARLTDIADLLRRQGEVLKKSGSELVWRDGSEKVTVREISSSINTKDAAGMPLTS